MAWSTTGRNRRADATAALINECSLHSSDPGSNGTTAEWSGGGYTRVAPSFSAASGGVAGLSDPMDFSGEPSTEANFMGFWAGDGQFLGSVGRESGDAAANAAGEYTVNQLNVDADGNIS